MLPAPAIPKILLSTALTLLIVPGNPSGRIHGSGSSGIIAVPLPQDCPPEGNGGDPELNKQKNRVQSTGAVKPMTFSQIVGLNSAAVNKKGRYNWTDAQKQKVSAVENGDRVVEIGRASCRERV